MSIHVPKDAPGTDRNKNFITPVHGSSQEKESYIRDVAAEADQRELEEEWGGSDDEKPKSPDKPKSPAKEAPKKVNHLAINTAGLD